MVQARGTHLRLAGCSKHSTFSSSCLQLACTSSLFLVASSFSQETFTAFRDRLHILAAALVLQIVDKHLIAPARALLPLYQLDVLLASEGVKVQANIVEVPAVSAHPSIVSTPLKVSSRTSPGYISTALACGGMVSAPLASAAITAQALGSPAGEEEEMGEVGEEENFFNSNLFVNTE